MRHSAPLAACLALLAGLIAVPPARAQGRVVAQDASLAGKVSPRAVPLPSSLERRGVRVTQTEPRLGVPTFVFTSRPERRGDFRRMTAEAAARAQLAELAALYRVTPQTLSTAPIRAVHDTGSGGIIVSLRQEVFGLEVFRGELRALLDRDHDLLAVSGHFAPDEGRARGGRAPSFVLSEPDAAAAAIGDLIGRPLDPSRMRRSGERGGYGYVQPGAGQLEALGAVLLRPARLRPVLFPLPEGLEPAYYAEVHVGRLEGRGSDDAAYVVSASDGRVLLRHDLTSTDFTYRVWADASGEFVPFDGPHGNAATPHPTGVPDGFQPAFVLPNLVTLPHGPISTLDPWLPALATVSTGNNVDAYADLVSADGFNAGDLRASTSSVATFDYTYDVTSQPGASAAQQMAAITQLFFLNNWLHDWYYDAGFDEVSRNAQSDNYGRGGVAGDRLLAEAQDYSGRNNANMMTPADGSSPRMQMFIFDANPEVRLTVISPASIAGDYQAGSATFGPQAFDLTGQLVRVNDGTAPTGDGCETPFTNAAQVAGRVALIDRGTCPFADKVMNAENNGAIGVVIANNQPGILDMGGTTPNPTIPSMLVSQDAGASFDGALGSGTVDVRLYRQPGNPDRDGTIDNAIVAHEWGHYISNRLIGNGSGLSNNQGRGMGEGWSDFHALLMMVRPEDAPTAFAGVYAVAGYVMGGGTNDGHYFGIRRVPYSIDFDRNALTFKHIANGNPLPTHHPVLFGADGADNAQFHNTGEVWSSMLWECYASLLRDTSRLTFQQAQQRMKGYLVAAYKLTPSSPTMLEARDALLAAAAANDGQDYALFWQAFARRGAGMGAEGPDRTSTDHIPVVESYVAAGDLELVEGSFDDSVSSCDADGTLDNGEEGLVTVWIRNTGAATVSDATATLSGSSTALSFPDGPTLTFPPVAPFATVSASVRVALTGAATAEFVTVTVAISASGLAQPTPIVEDFRAQLNHDTILNASSSDDVEAVSTLWTVVSAQGMAGPWRITEATGNHFWYGPDPAETSDQSLVSPPLSVGTGTFSFSYSNRFKFERSQGKNWDGGVLELSQDDGVSWVDIGAAIYNGTIVAGGTNPLAGRVGFINQSAGYPAFSTATVTLGTTYAGKTVRIRFRIGADQAVGDAGWEVDDVVFTGLTEGPFPAYVANAATCGGNTAPIAAAGADQAVDEGVGVTLSGTGSSDPDGDPLTYSWVQTAGAPLVTLTGATTATATFTAPAVMAAGAVLTFTLTVNDGSASSSDAVVVTVNNVNQAPVANAGANQTVDERTLVTLDGSGSTDPDGDALTYAWTQTAGSMVILSDAAAPSPTFTAPDVSAAGEVLTFQLTVSDGSLAHGDTMQVTVNNANDPPVANAGTDQLVDQGVAVVLNGTGSSDPDGDTLQYAWSQVGGSPTVTLTGGDTPTPSFDAPLSDTVLTFSLVVTDGWHFSAPSEVTVTVRAANQAPVADAGTRQVVNERTGVILDGSGSTDPDGDVLLYSWAQTDGTPTVTLTGANTATPTFTAPEVGRAGKVFTFALTVDDGVATSLSSVEVEVVNVNRAPVAHGGPAQTVDERTQVTLDATASSDPDGDVLSFAWTQLEGAAATLSDASAASPTFTAPEVTTTTALLFSVEVSDGLATDSTVVEITVLNVNRAPVATAVASGGTPPRPLDTLTLNGSGSSDPDGDSLTYAWSQLAGEPVTLSSTTAAVVTFTAPEVSAPEHLFFRLTVTDPEGLSATADASFNVEPEEIGEEVAAGCGCATGGGSASAWMAGVLLALGFVRVRRRRQAGEVG